LKNVICVGVAHCTFARYDPLRWSGAINQLTADTRAANRRVAADGF